MRTTLSIDDDVLLAAQERARREKRSVGAVVSELARATLTGDRVETGTPPQPAGDDGVEAVMREMGVFPLPRRGGVVTNDLINQIKDEIDY